MRNSVKQDLTLVGFDGGYGSGYLARVVGHKSERSLVHDCKQYSAEEALAMDWINTVVPIEQVEDVTIEWAEEMLKKSPLALRMIKAAMNADTDGLAGYPTISRGCDASILHHG